MEKTGYFFSFELFWGEVKKIYVKLVKIRNEKKRIFANPNLIT